MSEFMEKSRALRAETAVHHNCAQATAMPFAEAAGVDAETVRRLAANFGGGMKRAATCGAVCGGLMVLGLFGMEDPAVLAEYYRRLRERHGPCLDCAELLRINRDNGGEKKPHCDAMVFECVALAEALARENGKL